jgi:hypothetical protein
MSKTIDDHTLAFGVTKITPSIRFLASLSDGRTVIQDNRVGERHAWVRLSEWLSNNDGIFITGLRLQGPNGVNISMPHDQPGYFFGLKKNAVWGGAQFDYIGIGYYDGQIVNVCWHRQPLFNHSFSDERTVQQAGFFLIAKK